MNCSPCNIARNIATVTAVGSLAVGLYYTCSSSEEQETLRELAANISSWAASSFQSCISYLDDSLFKSSTTTPSAPILYANSSIVTDLSTAASFTSKVSSSINAADSIAQEISQVISCGVSALTTSALSIPYSMSLLVDAITPQISAAVISTEASESSPVQDDSVALQTSLTESYISAYASTDVSSSASIKVEEGTAGLAAAEEIVQSQIIETSTANANADLLEKLVETTNMHYLSSITKCASRCIGTLRDTGAAISRCINAIIV